MRLRRIAGPAAALAVWLTGIVAARAASAGGESLDFLNLDAGARPAALGGAHAAVASGAAALHYNPAGLARTRRHEASFMHHQYIEGATQEHISAALTQGLGVSLQYLGAARQQRTTVSKPDGAGLGDYGLSDMALAFGYGRSVGPLDLGASVKYVRESIDNVVASGALIDLGARYEHEALPGAALGVAVSNLGPAIRYQTAREPAPLAVRFGAAYLHRFARHGLLFAADVLKQRSDGPRFGLGIEGLWSERVALRLGYNGFQDSGPGVAVGAGYALENLSLDYAFAPYGELGIGHRISLTWRWGGREEEASVRKAEEPAPVRVEPVDVLLTRAEATLDASQPGRAQKTLDALVVGPEHPLRVRYHSARGRAYLLSGSQRAAKEQFAEALRLAIARKEHGPAVIHSYFGIGLCLQEDANYPYALKFMRKALELDPAPKLRRKIEDRIRAIEALTVTR